MLYIMTYDESLLGGYIVFTIFFVKKYFTVLITNSLIKFIPLYSQAPSPKELNKLNK